MTTQLNAQSGPIASASLYVGDLASEVTEALLFEIFNAVGAVASVRVCRDAASRRSLGYAYVNFRNPNDAERALDTMNFTSIRNKPCRIMWSQRDPSIRRSGEGNIFVKNLAKDIDNKTLYDTFSVFGNILSCKVATNSKGESLGYGFIHYESGECAQEAIEQCNGNIILDQTVTVEQFKSKKERGVGTTTVFSNLYIKNIPEDWTEETFKNTFAAFGKITSLMLSASKEGKTSHGGFGFVNFDLPENAAAAVEALNGKEFGDKTLFVGRAQKKSERQKALQAKFSALKAQNSQKFAGVNLYIKNLGDEVDDEKLRELFLPFGSITSCKVMTDASGKSRGFGFVCFETPEEATAAVSDLHGHMEDGKPLYVALAQRKDQRRSALEAQYTARSKMVPNNQMFGAPMFYQGGAGSYPRALMYPQQMVASRNFGPPMNMRGGPAANYNLIPQAAGRGRGRGGGRGRRSRGGRGGNFQYGQNVRNQQPMAPSTQQVSEAPVAQPNNAQVLAEQLAQAPADVQKKMIGERLYPLVQAQEPEQAGKITGMLLEMDNTELLHMLENSVTLKGKVMEAMNVLRAHEASQQASA